MNRTRVLLGLVSLIGLGAVQGCGTDDDETPSMTTETYAMSMMDDFCAAYSRCCPESEGSMVCGTSSMRVAQGLMQASLDEGVDRGWLEFDERAAEQCVQALHANSDEPSCEQVAELGRVPVGFEICEQVTRGLQGEGDPCEYSLGDGASSFSDAFCLPGLVCVGGVCTPEADEGEPCASDGWNDGCVDGAFCSDGTCTTALEDGAACQTHIQCSSNWCNEGVCATPSICNGENFLLMETWFYL